MSLSFLRPSLAVIPSPPRRATCPSLLSVPLPAYSGQNAQFAQDQHIHVTGSSFRIKRASQSSRSDPVRKIHEPQYQQYLKSNAEVAANLAALVKDFVEYGKTRTTLEAYERKLEVPR